MAAPTTPRVSVNGHAIAAIRSLASVTRGSLAAAMGVDVSYLSRIENGSRKALSPEKFKALTSVFAPLGIDWRAFVAAPPEHKASVDVGDAA